MIHSDTSYAALHSREPPDSVPAYDHGDISWLIDSGSTPAVKESSNQQNTQATPTFPAYPHNPANVLDNMLPRGLLYKLVDLHFEYVYPLTPLLHKPTFMRDLDSRREDRSGEEDWTALVLSMVAATIAYLPRPFIPIPHEEARCLVQRCYQHVRGWQIKEMEGFTIERGMSLLCTLILGITLVLHALMRHN